VVVAVVAKTATVNLRRGARHLAVAEAVVVLWVDAFPVGNEEGTERVVVVVPERGEVDELVGSSTIVE